MEGKCIAKQSVKYAVPWKENEELSVGGKEVELSTKIPFERFTSGQCFMSALNGAAAAVKPVKRPAFKGMI